jgi:hypothetical protein
MADKKIKESELGQELLTLIKNELDDGDRILIEHGVWKSTIEKNKNGKYIIKTW